MEMEGSFRQDCSNVAMNRCTGPRGGRSVAVTVKRPVDAVGQGNTLVEPGGMILSRPATFDANSLTLSYVPGRIALIVEDPIMKVHAGRTTAMRTMCDWQVATSPLSSVKCVADSPGFCSNQI